MKLIDLDEPLRPWTPPPEAPDAETNIALWALENSSGSASAMAALYTALSLPNWGAVPIGEMSSGLDGVRQRWLLAGIAQRLDGLWTAEYITEMEEKYPEISKAARVAEDAYRKAKLG